MALSLSSVIKWILCLIGGLPLLQILSITFGKAPIPFAKIGGFPPKSIQDIVKAIKDKIEDGKSGLDALKEEFTIPQNIKKDLEAVETSINELTANNFAALRSSFPRLSEAVGDVAVAREELFAIIGEINSYAANTKMLGYSVKQWADLASDDTLTGAYFGFKGHVSELSGVLSDDKIYQLQAIPAYSLVGYVNTTANSNTVIANFNNALYPSPNVGQIVKIANTDYRVLGKTFQPISGNVRVNANSTIVYTTNVNTLNLANIYLGNTTTVRLESEMYIRVNNEVRRINTVNALGDYISVYSPFFQNNSNALIETENGFRTNTVIQDASSNTALRLRTFDHANSQCLGDTITSSGTFYQAFLQAGDKIYYDEKEYYISSLTQTQIIVDDRLRELQGQYVYKVMDEIPVQRTVEEDGPDDILATFATVDQVTVALGSDFIDGMSTRYRKSDGTYARIDAYKPIHVTKAIQSGPDGGSFLANLMNRKFQELLDELQDDVIVYLTDNELVDYLNLKKQEVFELKNRVKDQIAQDKAAINAVKSLIKNLLKLFKASCSKKKKGDDPEDPDLSSDEYLNLVLSPNPKRQGCAATVSDLPEILDEADDEYNTIDLPPVDLTTPFANTDPALFTDQVEEVYGLDIPRRGGEGDGDVRIDRTPDSLLPETPNRCIEPC